MITLRKPWPIQGCRADDDDVDDDIPNKDQNVYLNFKIPFLWVKIVHLFGKIRDRLKTVGEFYRNVNILRSQFHKFA